MSSDSFKKRKGDLEKKLVTTIIDAYRDGHLDYFAMKRAAKYILDTIDYAQNEQHLAFMLKQLTDQSPVFKNLLLVESEDSVKTREKAVIDRLSQYIKNYPTN